MTYEFHPLANIFPLIEGQSYQDLMADVMRHGVREPVWLYEGKILDGRNRYRAASAMGVRFETRQYEGPDAVGFVISLNLHRRHLTESQRAAVAAKLANLSVGDNKGAHRPAQEGSANLQTLTGVSQADAAKLLNVSTRSVAAAAKVIHEGADELIHAVERGEVAVSAAAKVAGLPKGEQQVVIQEGRVKEVAKAARHVGKPKTGPKADAAREELKAAKERGVSMLCTYARLFLTALNASEEFSEEERELLAEVAGAINTKGVLHEV
jgi:hypothetical protein